MSPVVVSAALWIVIAVCALTLELLGIFHYRGMWPLTWLVRDAMAKWGWVASFVAAFLGLAMGWLYYHFLIAPRRFGRRKK